ncbi:MAG: hypothetical protein M0C28_11595 [Candidatus Moduliflexus flocculans]|nr:hypothetical protein [Candidatus Moduliflexus flocculans]
MRKQLMATVLAGSMAMAGAAMAQDGAKLAECSRLHEVPHGGEEEERTGVQDLGGRVQEGRHQRRQGRGQDEGGARGRRPEGRQERRRPEGDRGLGAGAVTPASTALDRQAPGASSGRIEAEEAGATRLFLCARAAQPTHLRPRPSEQLV